MMKVLNFYLLRRGIEKRDFVENKKQILWKNILKFSK